MKEQLIADLSTTKRNLEQFRSGLREGQTAHVKRADLRQRTQEICQYWFENVEPVVLSFDVDEKTRDKYRIMFTDLLRLCVRVSRTETYIRIISAILLGFDDDLLITVMRSSGRIVSVKQFSMILQNTFPEESEYLTEALGCASRGFFRASVVLAWSAAVHRMQKVIEKLGLEEFSKKTEEMRKIEQGRFKRFNKSFIVHTVGELQATVFDKDLLWVLEYWGLIDSNQHERLSICLTMRDNSAHPCEAPITEQNLGSFYSDLKTMVFDNPSFRL